jgi:hypothetical protein
VQKKEKDRELPESIFFATFLACPKKGGPKKGTLRGSNVALFD